MTPAQPLVSVAMPFYNAAATLPMALASLQAQTYTNWECILVDDGSTDGSAGLAESLVDPRIRIKRLPDNQGRSVARQVALEAAHGDYLCSLDADDWLYPHHLSQLLAFLEAEPRVGLVGAGIAVMDAAQALCGVRMRDAEPGAVRVRPPTRTARCPAFALPGHMVRTDVVKGYRYDPALYRAEDADLVLQVIGDHPYGVLGEVSYAYRMEGADPQRTDQLFAYAQCIRVIWKHRRRGYAAAFAHLTSMGAKYLLFGAARMIGRQDALIRRRSVAPSPEQIAAFYAARKTVSTACSALFEGVCMQARSA